MATTAPGIAILLLGKKLGHWRQLWAAMSHVEGLDTALGTQDSSNGSELLHGATGTHVSSMMRDLGLLYLRAASPFYTC